MVRYCLVNDVDGGGRRGEIYGRSSSYSITTFGVGVSNGQGRGAERSDLIHVGHCRLSNFGIYQKCTRSLFRSCLRSLYFRRGVRLADGDGTGISVGVFCTGASFGVSSRISTGTLGSVVA